MNIWLAIKGLNRRYDAWQAGAAARIVAKLDHPRDSSDQPPTSRHVSVWDLLSSQPRGALPAADPEAK